ANNGNAVITVKNAAGKTIAVKNTIASKGANTVEINNSLAKGFYTATVSVNGVTVATEKVIAE
ncbi:MAG TPA: T9SS type A sorting domain-containing protein, partial [Ferruginibacter sp.]|nr:T9SS type A sorting domain-containing protein [Ferruginibacter sp.]